MTVKVGNKTYHVSTPDDLDARVLASTGGSVEEMRAAVATSPYARVLATAAAPFLKDGPSLPELAAAIAEAGVENVRADVAALYEPKPADKSTAKAPANGG